MRIHDKFAYSSSIGAGPILQEVSPVLESYKYFNPLEISFLFIFSKS